YEIKLPRELKRLQISSEAGDVKVSDFGGELEVELKSGDIEVAAEGPVRTKLTNGTTRVTYEGRREAAQEFSVVNGRVEVEFAEGSEATIRAETANGDIKTEGDIDGLVPERRGAGRRLEAQLGEGGGRLAAKVGNGDIKLKQ
ncbi:MAG TPA: DUF4097 family beta strand repeat-containing protein, partial [Pyrinomonadaceae bacterium]|nr:DUF4097 family beta strand repeat-containing protein [Pyrinomonadaceae bacterium]